MNLKRCPYSFVNNVLYVSCGGALNRVVFTVNALNINNTLSVKTNVSDLDCCFMGLNKVTLLFDYGECESSLPEGWFFGGSWTLHFPRKDEGPGQWSR